MAIYMPAFIPIPVMVIANPAAPTMGEVNVY